MMGTDIEAAAIAAALGAFTCGAIAEAALGLEPGDVILSSSFTQAVPVAAADTVNTDFGGVRPAVHHIRERKVEGDLMLESLDHDTGGYAYLPGGDFASGGRSGRGRGRNEHATRHSHRARFALDGAGLGAPGAPPRRASAGRAMRAGALPA